MESVYGLGGPMSPESLTYEERIKMRRLLDELDRKEAGGTKTFDLAKPPVDPYRYREFPFLMYNHETHATKAARDSQERERMAAQGWSEKPFPAEGAEIELTGLEREEAAEIDKRLVKKGARK